MKILVKSFSTFLFETIFLNLFITSEKNKKRENLRLYDLTNSGLGGVKRYHCTSFQVDDYNHL